MPILLESVEMSLGVMLKGVHKMELEEALASIYDEVSVMNQMDGAIQISVSVGMHFMKMGL